MVSLVIPLVPMVPLETTVGSQYCRRSTVRLFMDLPMVPMVYQIRSRFYHGTIGNTIGTNGNDNGTICSPNGTNGTVGYQWYHWKK